ncbi:hypothetical protein KEM48_012115 [Puccinia striiformis f. sp. tritici PST-130]|nr:hypothetical protein KEM48_012115 [Puccinia striiformis f. sp. tritici PST-130]
MRPLTDAEIKTLFSKLNNYVGKNLVHLINREDEEYCFRFHRDRVFYISENLMKSATSISKDTLISSGICLGKFSKTGKFKLHITSLDIISKYAQYKGFGVTARSTTDTKKLDPTSISFIIRLMLANILEMNTILQSPPGEVNDVFNDVRPIVGDDSELERGLLPALAQYNTEQLTLVELPNAKIPGMICPAARIDQPGPEQEEGKIRYLDPHSQQTFIFDHLRRNFTYILFSIDKFKLYIVGNKYNPTNYWTGRWRSIYEIDLSSGTIKGEIQVNVHYYEQGNVQLSTNHSPEIEPISTTNTKKVIEPEEIMKVIQIAESKYQASLNSAYTDFR